MTERVARSQQPAPAADASEAPPIKHCWVTTGSGRLPGLLLEWRKRPDWHGRVIHAVPAGAEDGWIIVEEWLPAGLLDPIEGASATGQVAP